MVPAPAISIPGVCRAVPDPAEMLGPAAAPGCIRRRAEVATRDLPPGFLYAEEAGQGVSKEIEMILDNADSRGPLEMGAVREPVLEGDKIPQLVSAHAVADRVFAFTRDELGRLIRIAILFAILVAVPAAFAADDPRMDADTVVYQDDRAPEVDMSPIQFGETRAYKVAGLATKDGAFFWRLDREVQGQEVMFFVPPNGSETMLLLVATFICGVVAKMLVDRAVRRIR